MAQAGDFIQATLHEAHINWGVYRRTGTREPRVGEAYIPIHKNDARRLELLNSNGTNRQDVFGKNLFYYTTEDNMCHGILRAQGASTAGDIYAKQFSTDGNLRELGDWFRVIDAKVGDIIYVKWVSPVDVVLSKR